MKILFLCVGTLKKDYIKEGFSDYIARIKRYVKVDVVEVKEGLGTKKAPKTDVVRREGRRILEKIKEDDLVIALVVDGVQLGTKEFASIVESALSGSTKRLVFIIGGSYGLHDSVLSRVKRELSLSTLTLPHELARFMLVEQVYRAFTIIRGEPYSH